MLWMRHAGSGNAIGEVAIERITVTTTVDGVLMDLPGRVIKPHDRVRQGDEIARIDTTPLEARRAQRQVDVERLRAEIKAAEANPGGSSSPGVSNEDHLKSLRTALANPLTGLCGVVHGVAVGMMLPQVVRFNSQNGERPYSDLMDDPEQLGRYRR